MRLVEISVLTLWIHQILVLGMGCAIAFFVSGKAKTIIVKGIVALVSAFLALILGSIVAGTLLVESQPTEYAAVFLVRGIWFAVTGSVVGVVWRALSGSRPSKQIEQNVGFEPALSTTGLISVLLLSIVVAIVMIAIIS